MSVVLSPALFSGVEHLWPHAAKSHQDFSSSLINILGFMNRRSPAAFALLRISACFQKPPYLVANMVYVFDGFSLGRSHR